MAPPNPHLSIGLLAPPWVPVPPPAYGGTELVVGLLADGLAAAGCDVTLFTTGDATAAVDRRWLYPEALGTTADPAAELPHVRRAYAVLDGADVLHDHTETGPGLAAPGRHGPAVVATAHGRLDGGRDGRWRRAAASGVALVAISRAQARSAPGVDVAATIHHGVDVGSFRPGRGDGGYVLFLGRMSPDKGAHRAIVAARAAGKRILLAAKAWEPEERRYLDEVVSPLLGPDAEYVGEVGRAAKLELLAGAEALVNPIRWPEPFGLVMVEALASGTPVVGFPDGAAAEIVEHGRTGYLCRDGAELAHRLRTVHQLDRSACRAAAVERFAAEVMVDAHLALYRRLLAPHRRPVAAAGG